MIGIQRCNPSGVEENSCDWYSCIGKNALSFQATSPTINIVIRYSEEVDKSSSCQYKPCENEPARFGQAVARIKLGKTIEQGPALEVESN